MLRKRINKQPHPCSQGRGSHAKSRGSQNLTRALVPIRLLSLEGFHPGPLKGGPFSEVPTIRSKVTMRHVYAWGSRYFLWIIPRLSRPSWWVTFHDLPSLQPIHILHWSHGSVGDIHRIHAVCITCCRSRDSLPASRSLSMHMPVYK